MQGFSDSDDDGTWSWPPGCSSTRAYGECDGVACDDHSGHCVSHTSNVADCSESSQCCACGGYGTSCNIDFALEYTSDGACPVGWTCTGEAQGWDGTEVGPSSSYAGGYAGNGYLVVGADSSLGTATSAQFWLGSGINTVDFARCGGADWPSGFYVKSADDDSTVCSATDGTDTDDFFETSCDVSSFAGGLVYIFVEDAQDSSWGKVYIDNIRFTDDAGNERTCELGAPRPRRR